MAGCISLGSIQLDQLATDDTTSFTGRFFSTT
jgi:hypothetical protein